MLDVEERLFTQIMLKHYNDKFKEKDIFLKPEQTKHLIYIFNQTRKKSVYEIMTYYVYKSSFIELGVHVDMCMLFTLAQRTYKAFTKLALLWKQQHSTSSITNDLMLVPLSNYKASSVITLYEKGKPYTFHLPDLYNIIVEAFTHCSHDYFLEIKPIKNPYTNLPFHLCNIYNIYLAYKNSTFSMPNLFRAYIECDCIKEKFMHIHEPLIRDICIENRFKTITNYKCVKVIRTMLNDDVMLNNIDILIDNNFPWENLIYHFKPFAKLYHKVIYGLNPYSKHVNKMILIKKLKLFKEENPLYGRKFVNPKPPLANHFIFGLGNRNSYETTVKTHFNDMTKDKLKRISTIRRYTSQNSQTSVSRIQEDDSDDSDDSDDDNNDEEMVVSIN
tara:strand:+ start:3114 stop:4277 length:1164 start_codon:yes stop_codon:yes gene_type:complete